MVNFLKSSFSITFSELQHLAKIAGLEVVGVTEAVTKPIESSRLKLWQENGYAADMKYMQRDPLLQSDPMRLLPEAKTVISIAVSYSSEKSPVFVSGFGRVARYAWGKDYHLVLPDLLSNLVDLIKNDFGDFKFRIFSDAVPFLERAFAASAGLGFIGKNTLLIRPKLGSFTLLAEILCDFEVRGFSVDKSRSNCGSCIRCISNCPTSAFKSEYVLDAGKCISYLSIEKRGDLSLAERRMLGEWIFGCDICQEVCPFNHSSIKKSEVPSIDRFSAHFGVGPLLKLSEILEIKENEQFKHRYKDSPLLRAKREGLIRNAICVAVNTAVFDLIPRLKVLCREDFHPLVRQFALWGFVELMVKSGERFSADSIQLLQQALLDPDPHVVKEASELIEKIL